MKTLYKKASPFRAHTWKDIGGIPGLLLDGLFFVFVTMCALVMIVIGFLALLADYLVYPVLALLSLFRGHQAAKP